MKKIKILFLSLFGTLLFTLSAISAEPDYSESGVNFKGIAVFGDWNGDGTKTILYWAPVNCGYEEVGEVNTDTDHRLGKLYQWGAGDSSLSYMCKDSLIVVCEMYYDTETPTPWYGSNIVKGNKSDEWNNSQGPCPEGWRLPTSNEFKVLCAGKNGNYGWTSCGTYAGQPNIYAGSEFFGENSDKTSGTGVFLPAAGYRNVNDGSALYREYYGSYWSSTPNPIYEDYAYFLRFGYSHLGTQASDGRAGARSVRCVTE